MPKCLHSQDCDDAKTFGNWEHLDQTKLLNVQEVYRSLQRRNVKIYKTKNYEKKKQNLNRGENLKLKRVIGKMRRG